MVTAHLVYGYLGAGKTTLARELAARHHAALISIDEWYLRLFTDATPTPHLDAEKWQRLADLLHEHWPQILRAGADVVLDLGLWSRADRDRARAAATEAGAECVLYWVRTDDETALARCLARNSEPGASFIVDEAAYAQMRVRYDEPDADEAVEIITT